MKKRHEGNCRNRKTFCMVHCESLWGDFTTDQEEKCTNTNGNTDSDRTKKTYANGGNDG